MSQETLQTEILHIAKLQNKRRGELAELAFMRKAATYGFVVAKPWGDSLCYDFVVRAGKAFWRIQVKSVRAKSPNRRYYRVGTVKSPKLPYSSEDIDFLVAYIFAEDIWYVFPAQVFENAKSLCLRPGSSRSRFEQYREAWKLIGSIPDEAAAAEISSPDETGGAPEL
jgi:hypothetical protein